ncbi:MAG TPA: hypothetical protein VK852_10370, partial [Desulfobacterales bacterium]|nr:hypothetical protein [Desulfobacterales bacterium]
MSQLPLDDAPHPGETLVCRLTPSGRIDVQERTTEDGPLIAAKTAERILAAFGAGRGHGVLHLGAA